MVSTSSKASNRPSRCAAMSAPTPANSCTSTSRNSAASRRRPPHHRRPARASNRGAGARLGVRPCLHRRRLAPRLLQMLPDEKEGKRHRLPQGRHRLLRQPRHQGDARHDRQRLVLQSSTSAPPAATSASSTSAPNPTRPGPTARPNASSRRRSANGPMPRPIPLRHRAAELPVWLHRYNWHRPHGSLKSKPPSAASASPRTTC
jgi:hypothetical protein